MKKIIALVLALVLCAGLFVGCNGNGGGVDVDSQINTDAEGPLFTAPTKINVYTGANATYDIEGNYIDKLLLEQENIDLNNVEMESGVFQQMIVDQDLPDITFLNANMYGNEYGPKGAFINILEYLDQMPNLKAALKANPEMVEHFLAENGALYHIPCVTEGRQVSEAAYAFIYRQDIFEKHNLTFPTTRDEFLNTLRELKKLYPNSYPFVLRQMSGNMQGFLYLCMSFGTQLALTGTTQTVMDYDHKNQEWFYGPTSDGMKDMVSFLAQLYKEDLLHKSTITLTSAQWTQAFAMGDDKEGVSFIGWDKMDRIPAQLQSAGQELNPEFNLVAGAPIKFNELGEAATFDEPATFYNFLVASSCKNLDQTLAYIDWLYSDEGRILTNWGKEGETFEYDENGNPRWLPALLEETDPQNSRGLAVLSSYGVRDMEAYLQLQTPEHIKNIELASSYQTLPARPTLTYSKEEQTIYDTYWIALHEYARGELQKFIIGERDIATWDTYVKTVESDTYMFNQLMKIHEDAYQRKTSNIVNIDELLG